MGSSGERRRDFVASLLLFVLLCASFELQHVFESSASARASERQQKRPASPRSCSSCSCPRRQRRLRLSALSLFLAAPVAQGGEVQLRSRSRRALTSADDLLKLRLRAHGPRVSSSRSRAPRQLSGSSKSVTRKALCFALCSRAPGRAAFSRSRRSSARAPRRRDDGRTCCTCELALSVSATPTRSRRTAALATSLSGRRDGRAREREAQSASGLVRRTRGEYTDS